jgi:hypothetical protein
MGKPVAGAIVRICCEQTVSRIGLRQSPGYSLQVPAGRYYATAKATVKMPDGALWGLDGGVDTGMLTAPGPNWIDIPLQPPPPEKRMILVTGHADLTDVELFDSDTATKPFNCPPMYAEWDPAAGAAYIAAGYSKDDQSEGDSHVRLEVWIDDVRSDRTIKGRVRVSMPDEDNMSWDGTFSIPEDGSQSWTTDMDTGGSFPDRVHAEYTVLNQRAP